MIVKQKHEIMEKKTPELEDLKQLRAFLKSKKISLAALSKEMDYSTSHVLNVFNGASPVHHKFVRAALKASQGILQKDLKEFYELMRGKSWSTFTRD